MTPAPEAYRALRPPHPLRRHQREALAALEAARQSGRQRAWVVLPPGAGKTMVGLETIRRLERPAVVLSPNAAIQQQWVRGWQQFRDSGDENRLEVGTERSLATPVTSVTYQSLAVFRDEAEPDEPEAESGGELERLHPNGLAFVHRLRKAGPITLVLDECHHLLEVWGRLLMEVLEQLPEATVLGLTATPATTLSGDQARLVDTLFGDVVYQTSIPAVVREGHLAPFADLVWLTAPTAAESEWLAGQSERFTQLTTDLLAPDLGTVPFLTWLDRVFAGEASFARVAERRPELADAALRLRHAGVLRLSDEVTDHEQHRHPPTADDWARLISAWHDECLAPSDDLRDLDAREALRRSLPAVGYRLTTSGVQRGRSTVDRVLARSEAKSRALVEIVDAEHRILGERLAMLVICDHEAASATTSVDLRGVTTEQAGSARHALATLVADPATSGLAPVMVTGRTVAAAPDVLKRLQDELGPQGETLVVGPPDDDGVSELTGAWSTRQWVGAVTDFFERGPCRVLIGTRALLGEGWDAPTASGLIDLSAARTPGTVVQTRGRTLRLDPEDPRKVAVNWTVCCVSDQHPNGDHDWLRAVDKHRGYFGVDPTGDIVDGVAHIHPTFSPYAPPPTHSFDATNAEMQVRAQRRREIADAWQVGRPYADEIRPAVWVHAERTAPPPGLDQQEHPRPPDVVLTADGLRWRGTPPREPARRSPVAVLTGVTAALLLVFAWVAPGPFSLWLAAAAVLAGWAVAEGAAARNRRRRHRREVLDQVPREPDPVTVAYALGDALHEAGLVAAGAEAVHWGIADDGRLRVRLDAGDPDGEQSGVFADAYAELMGPVGRPRYVVPRYPMPSIDDELLARPLDQLRPDGVVWHPVPSILGGKAELAQAFARAWARWVGGGAAVYTGSPEGAGALAAVRGANPFDASAVVRLTWR